MKRARKSLLLVALSGIAVVAARAAINLAQDVGHYNRLREMSGQGPIWQDVPGMLRQVLNSEPAAPAIVLDALKSIPREAARYLRLESM